VTSAKKNPLEHMIELVNYFPTVILTVKTLFLNMKVGANKKYLLDVNKDMEEAKFQKTSSTSKNKLEILMIYF
jgi:hypothetical protein